MSPAAQLQLDGASDRPRVRWPREETWAWAILPDGAAISLAGERRQLICERHDLHGKPVRAENLHVSVHGFGSAPGRSPEMLNAILDTAATVVAPAFELRFDRVARFHGARGATAVVLRGCDGDSAAHLFRDRLLRALRERGLDGTLPHRAFTPHLTLLHTAQPIGECEVEPVSWIAREFVLVRSFTGRGLHRIAGRWPLCG